jgi:hypothetical protein
MLPEVTLLHNFVLAIRHLSYSQQLSSPSGMSPLGGLKATPTISTLWPLCHRHNGDSVPPLELQPLPELHVSLQAAGNATF